MKKILLAVFILIATVGFAQTPRVSGMNKKEMLDSLYVYILKSNSWKTFNCPRTDFDTETDWSRPFYYRWGGYKIRYTRTGGDREPYATHIDTSNLSIYFPYEDIGGPGKASGIIESFILHLKDLKSYSLNVNEGIVELRLSSHENTLVGEYSRINYCNKLKYEFSILQISFRLDELPLVIRQKLERILKLLIQ